MMHLFPLLKMLWRSKIGPALIILQLALSIAIISNALFFVNNRIEQTSRPTGIDQAQLARVWVKDGAESSELQQMVSRDIAALKTLTGIESAAPMGSVPFSHSGYSSGFHNLHASAGDAGRLRTPAGVVETDHRAVDTLGLKLIAGRNFLPEEVVYFTRENTPASAHAIISQSVAEQVFPGASAVGNTIYLAGEIPLMVVGVVEDFLGYFPSLDFAQRNVLISAIEKKISINYVLRTEASKVDSLLYDAEKMLRGLDGERIVGEAATISQLIKNHYHADYAMIILLLVVMSLLVLTNMLGIVGITTFWVNQRRRQIGIRRALGATRAAIIRLFLLENTLLVAAATLLGAFIAFWASHLLVQRYAFELLPWHYVPLAGLAVLVIALAAATLPARRAALISPREAVCS
ncbi:MAG TPA: FtsX-like permease family protein [Cellvibrionaceae bacterium]